MSLKIKNEEPRRAIAERLKRSQTRRHRAGLVERMLKIGRECAALPVLDRRKPEAMLYDKDGLPQ